MGTSVNFILNGIHSILNSSQQKYGSQNVKMFLKIWKRLNGGTVPSFKMHHGGTVPPSKMHRGGTVPPFKRHHGGSMIFEKNNVLEQLAKPNHNQNSTLPKPRLGLA